MYSFIYFSGTAVNNGPYCLLITVSAATHAQTASIVRDMRGRRGAFFFSDSLCAGSLPYPATAHLFIFCKPQMRFCTSRKPESPARGARKNALRRAAIFSRDFARQEICWLRALMGMAGWSRHRPTREIARVRQSPGDISFPYYSSPHRGFFYLQDPRMSSSATQSFHVERVLWVIWETTSMIYRSCFNKFIGVCLEYIHWHWDEGKYFTISAPLNNRFNAKRIILNYSIHASNN